MSARQRAAIARTEGRLARSAAGRHQLGGAPSSTGPRQTGVTAPVVSRRSPADDNRDEARVGGAGPSLDSPSGLPLPAGRDRTRTSTRPDSGVTAARGTKNRLSGDRDGSDPAPSRKHALSPFEVAAARAAEDGRRDQRCPRCGREEAGGAYCTGCYRRVHPDEWTDDTARSRAARANMAARDTTDPDDGSWPA
jgi:hypothetical protein